MNEEQLIATLQACYFGDRGAFNKILKEYKNLQQENQQLKEENKDMKRTIELFSNSLYNADLKKYKSTLEELRELVESYNLGKYDYSIPPNGINDLLQIIDKTKESDA